MLLLRLKHLLLLSLLRLLLKEQLLDLHLPRCVLGTWGFLLWLLRLLHLEHLQLLHLHLLHVVSLPQHGLRQHRGCNKGVRRGCAGKLSEKGLRRRG